mmetsp:Transcript_139853/g.243493  ORF Transcript_139853/g.243493 Transcript_139853/m.243493 type:complete len:82 (-) Transcript_139853:571-816(-)
MCCTAPIATNATVTVTVTVAAAGFAVDITFHFTLSAHTLTCNFVSAGATIALRPPTLGVRKQFREQALSLHGPLKGTQKSL